AHRRAAGLNGYRRAAHHYRGFREHPKTWRFPERPAPFGKPSGQAPASSARQHRGAFLCSPTLCDSLPTIRRYEDAEFIAPPPLTGFPALLCSGIAIFEDPDSDECRRWRLLLDQGWRQ